MLQLLLERGQSYADLASLLGVDEAEVRARARAALTELAGADPDRHVGLTDYLLGQADPIGRADAVRHLKDDPADLELATEIAQKIRLIAPDAELPRLPGEERRPRPRRARRRAVPPPDPRSPAAQAPADETPRAVRTPAPRRPAHDAVQAPDPARGGARQRCRAGGDDRAWSRRGVQQRGDDDARRRRPPAPRPPPRTRAPRDSRSPRSRSTSPATSRTRSRSGRGSRRCCLEPRPST